LKGDTPIDFFCLYFDEELIKTIVDQTNLYYSQVGKEPAQASRMPSWCDGIIEEMYLFLATTAMLMSPTTKEYIGG
jgi:hypothetical protein